jgi:protein TonB
MSAAVNDRPHEIVPAVHLPLTGELHPLRREFARWLATGNLITITIALVTCASIYFWPRSEPVTGPPIDDFVKGGITFQPPPIVEHSGGGGEQFTFTPDLTHATFEPTNEPIEDDPSLDESKNGGGEEGYNDGPLGPVDTGSLYNTEPLDPPAKEPDFSPGWDDPPVLLSITPPVYPEMVKDAGIDGTVMVRVFITANGRVKDAYVVEGSPALREAALASARTALFKPAMQSSHPVEVWVVIPITFQLHEGY